MRSIPTILVIALFCFFWCCPTMAQNPFFGPPVQDRAQAKENGSIQTEDQGHQPPALRGPAVPRMQSPFFSTITASQRELRQKMTAYARQIRDNPLGSATWQLLGLSMLYGIIHALGPGHGKSIVCSYFLSRRGTMAQALAFGNLIAFVHVLSATFIILALAWYVGSANIAVFHQVEGRLESISYLLIMLIGAFLLGKTLYEWFSKNHRDSEGQEQASTKGMVSLSLASGMMPCPGAALILLFTLSLDVFWAGLLAMLPLALGMGLTTSIMGCATVGSTGYALNLGRRSRQAFILMHRTMACIGALIILLLGAGLFFGSRPPGI
jgi:nickel/cobalt transporter (NicO) family protein